MRRQDSPHALPIKEGAVTFENMSIIEWAIALNL